MLSRSPRGDFCSLGASAPFLLHLKALYHTGGQNLIQNPNFKSSATVYSGLNANREITDVY